MPIGPTSGFLDFTNATPRANVIVALSNIGIGTDVPLHAFDLRGTANVADIIVNNDLTLTGGLTTNSLTINSMSMSTTSNFQQVTNVGNVTTNTVEFTNPATGLAVTSNAEVGGELSVSGNVEVSGGATVSGNVGVGTTEPTETLDIVGNLNLQKVSNTASIKLNSNVVTEYTRSKKLIKYPRVAMTADSSGGYVASSSTSNQPPYKAFNNILFSSYFEPVYTTQPYPNTDGVYTGGTGTVYSTNGYEGDYLQIQLPEKIKLYSYSISNRKGSTLGGRQPKNAKIFASNDGSTWVDIHTHFDGGLTYEVNNGETRSFNLYSVPETYYKYYRLVVNSIIEGGGSDTPNISDWSLFGIPEYDPDADGTDVIARSVPNVPNTDWLEVYWDGGNTSSYSGSGTTVTDISPNTNDGTLSSGVGFDSTYKAFTFDGSGDYISGTQGVGTGQPVHSQSVWFKLSGTTGDYQYISIIGTSSPGAQAGLIIKDDGTTLLGSFYGGDRTITQITQSRWYHAVLVYPGGTTDKAKYYINGVEVSTTGTSGTPSLTGTNVYLGANTIGTQSFNGSIANFRLFNRALSADEVWQLYAYQKEYFGYGNLDMTLKSGRLGIGTSEPRAVLDVRGSALVGGIPYGLGTRPIFSAYEYDDYSVTATGYITLGDTLFNGLNCYNTTNGKFTAPLDGIYCFIGNCTIRSSGGAGNSTWTFHINDENWNPTSTSRPIAYQSIDTGTNHQNVSGSLILSLNKNDTVRIYVVAVPSNTNQNWGQGYGRLLGFLLS